MTSWIKDFVLFVCSFSWSVLTLLGAQNFLKALPFRIPIPTGKTLNVLVLLLLCRSWDSMFVRRYVKFFYPFYRRVDGICVVRHATVVFLWMTGSFKSIKEGLSSGMIGVLLSCGWAVLHYPGRVFFFLIVVEMEPLDWIYGLLFNFFSLLHFL